MWRFIMFLFKSSPIIQAIETMGSKCPLHKCLICSKGNPPCLAITYPTWPAILRVVLYTLATNSQDSRYFSIKQDIYPFIDYHWHMLCPNKSLKYHKQMQDSLVRGSYNFVSGRHQHGVEECWGLRNFIDPWRANDDDDSDVILHG